MVVVGKLAASMAHSIRNPLVIGNNPLKLIVFCGMLLFKFARAGFIFMFIDGS
jgi:hypothetical protein